MKNWFHAWFKPKPTLTDVLDKLDELSERINALEDTVIEQSTETTPSAIQDAIKFYQQTIHLLIQKSIDNVTETVKKPEKATSVTVQDNSKRSRLEDLRAKHRVKSNNYADFEERTS